MKAHPSLYSNRAACHIQLFNYEQAIKDCKDALKLDPTFGKPYKRMFKCYFLKGNFEVSIKINLRIGSRKMY